MKFIKNTLSILLAYTLMYAPKLYSDDFPSPTPIFPATSNKLLPSPYWLKHKKPYPTNAWFINLMLPEADAVTIFPYLMKISPFGISLSYTGPIFYAEPDYPSIISAFYYQFENQLTLGPSLPMPHYGLDSYHGLKITLQWQNKPQKITAPILQGSPYLTEFFTNTIPQLSTSLHIRSINSQTQGPLAPAQRYEILLAINKEDTQTWILYSEKPLLFNWNGKQLIATEPYSGWIRVILQKDTRMQLDNDTALLDKYSQTIPLEYQQTYQVNEQNIIYSFIWQTQNNAPPLMLSLPHQVINTSVPSTVTYTGIKGLLKGQTLGQWTMELPKIPILFLEPKNLSKEQTKALSQALLVDAEELLNHPFPDDGPYQVGKRYGRAARLILIAHVLKEEALKNRLLNFLKIHLRKKMRQESGWNFQYDTTWGGIIPSVDDYGARHYNDHHYHYGYWVYTFAVIGTFDPAWLNTPLKPSSFTPQQWIDTLIRDYANELKEDPYFPPQRYQDDYAGHSWASGLTAFKDGQNQQSSSEAVHAYYAIALYATLIQDKKLLDWAEFLMNRELVSAQTYWQISDDSALYNNLFKENNKVVGNLWDNKIDANAFFKDCKTEFRCGLEYSFGIQMLPFTAITKDLLNKKWLRDAYPLIKKLIENQYGPVPPAWKWILIKGAASIMDKKEKEYFFKQVQESKPDQYDDGDSKTNTLYFLI